MRHELLFMSQTSELDPQSALDSHWTHIPWARRHRGWSDGHELLPVHATHCWLAPLHAAAEPQS